MIYDIIRLVCYGVLAGILHTVGVHVNNWQFWASFACLVIVQLVSGLGVISEIY